MSIKGKGRVAVYNFRVKAPMIDYPDDTWSGVVNLTWPWASSSPTDTQGETLSTTCPKACVCDSLGSFCLAGKSYLFL